MSDISRDNILSILREYGHTGDDLKRWKSCNSWSNLNDIATAFYRNKWINSCTTKCASTLIKDVLDNEYTRDGFNSSGFNKCTGTKYDSEGYNKKGFNIDGFNREGIHMETGTEYDKYGFNTDGINKDTETEYDKNGFDKYGIHKDTETEYDKNGFDRDGFDCYGFNENGIHKDTDTEYDENGCTRTMYSTFDILTKDDWLFTEGKHKHKVLCREIISDIYTHFIQKTFSRYKEEKKCIMNYLIDFVCKDDDLFQDFKEYMLDAVRVFICKLIPDDVKKKINLICNIKSTRATEKIISKINENLFNYAMLNKLGNKLSKISSKSLDMLDKLKIMDKVDYSTYNESLAYVDENYFFDDYNVLCVR